MSNNLDIRAYFLHHKVCGGGGHYSRYKVPIGSFSVSCYSHLKKNAVVAVFGAT